MASRSYSSFSRNNHYRHVNHARPILAGEGDLLPDWSFLPLVPLACSLGGGGGMGHLPTWPREGGGPGYLPTWLVHGEK